MGLALLEYGRELAAAGAAQVGGSFTGDPAADEVLADPNAFVLGVLFTQGIAAERAWAGPYLLRSRLGTLDLDYLATHEALVASAVQQPPMLHRFKATLPRWITRAALRIRDDYGGDASRIWASGRSVTDVVDALLAFDGIGRKKAVMATEILVRHFGVELIGRSDSQVAYDIQVRRVFLRSGLVSVDSREAIERAAAALCPEAPGTLDLAAWLIGRETCRPAAPDCDSCRLACACPRLTTITPKGVGARSGA